VLKCVKKPQKLLLNTFETSNKLNKIYFKGLNSRILEVGGLDWTKVSNID